jgi:Mce-associated membrane protein
VLGWGGWSLWSATGRSDDLAKDRDLVLRAGERQIAALNSMGCGNTDVSLKRWLDSATGPLHDQLQRDWNQNKQKIDQARTCAVGTVTAAAVTAVDRRAGDAQILAAVQVRLTPAGGSPSVERRRYEAGLARTPDGWKLKSLTAIPVDAA